MRVETDAPFAKSTHLHHANLKGPLDKQTSGHAATAGIRLEMRNAGRLPDKIYSVIHTISRHSDRDIEHLSGHGAFYQMEWGRILLEPEPVQDLVPVFSGDQVRVS